MNRQIIATLKERILQSRSIVIVTHTNPDGDAIGSSLGWFHFLQSFSINAKISVVVPNDFPAFLKWMPGVEQILIYAQNQITVQQILDEADLCFCLDFNALNRTDQLAPLLINSNAFKVLVDHHPQPDASFDLMMSQVETSSTSELIYHIIRQMAGIEWIKSTIAACLYVGIMTDTGSFSYSCSRPDTYLAVADLIRNGADVELIHRKIYDTYSENRMRLLGFCLSERMVVLKELHTAYIYLTLEDLNRFNHQTGDTEGVVNYALSIEGIVLAALFTQKEDRIRLSLRSKGEFSVNDMARKHFNGGGHKNASGGDSWVPMTQTLVNFENILKEYEADLTNISN